MRRYVYIFQFFALVLLVAGCAWRREDDTIGRSAICELHHTPMVRTTIPIEYGFPHFSARDLARGSASTNTFPHADAYILGGCVVDEDSPYRALIYTCPQCLKTAHAWDSNYDKTNSSP